MIKKNIIALAVASAITSPVVFAGAPTVYGLANVALISDQTGKDTGLTVSGQEYRSRLGVKGSADLGDGMKAIYKMEFGVGMTADASSAIGARNQYVGLAGGFGTVLLGRHDTPLKMSQPKDLFNNGILDNRNMTNIGFGRGNGGEDRVGATLAYVTPKMSGVKAIIALVPNVALTTDGDDKTKAGLTNVYSLAVMYGSKKEGIYAAAAYNNADEDSGDINMYRISAQYASGGAIVNLIYQAVGGEGSKNTTNAAGVITSNGLAGTNYQLGVAYKIGSITPKLKYSGNSETDETGKKGSVIALGVDYSLGKKTKSYIEYGSYDKDFNGGGTAVSSSKIALGIQHKF